MNSRVSDQCLYTLVPWVTNALYTLQIGWIGIGKMKIHTYIISRVKRKTVVTAYLFHA